MRSTGVRWPTRRTPALAGRLRGHVKIARDHATADCATALAGRSAMMLKLGYLLSTREQVMEGRPETGSLLALAARAEALGYDLVWVGVSMLARPRHDPLTLLVGVAGRVPRVALGAAVLLPAPRNPHGWHIRIRCPRDASSPGVGIARDVPNVRAELAACGAPFEKRVGRMMEGLRLCRAPWTGETVDREGRWPLRGGAPATAWRSRRSGSAAMCGNSDNQDG